MPGKLDGKIALVTGGSSGIGLATAELFVKKGAFVYITGRRQSELDKAVKKIGKQVKLIRADVSNLPDLDRLFAQIKQEKGRLDVVFANAGQAKFVPLSDASLRERSCLWMVELVRCNQDMINITASCSRSRGGRYTVREIPHVVVGMAAALRTTSE